MVFDSGALSMVLPFLGPSVEMYSYYSSLFLVSFLLPFVLEGTLESGAGRKREGGRRGEGEGGRRNGEGGGEGQRERSNETEG
jgi:hypothetical protein